MRVISAHIICNFETFPLERTGMFKSHQPRGILSGEIIRLEIALTRDPIAKNCIRDHEKIRIKDPETGRPRILVAVSQDLPLRWPEDPYFKFLGRSYYGPQSLC